MIAAVLFGMTVFGAFEFRDSFEYPDGSEGAPAWFAESVGWRMDNHAWLFSRGPRGFAILEKSPHGSSVTVEATVAVEARDPGDWAVAGVGLRRDAANFWHLALVEGPGRDGAKHFVELCEALDGRWLAQYSEATRLAPLAGEGADFNWAYGHPYRLRLLLSRDRIEGFVEEPDGTVRAHLGFRLDKRAVTSGQPVLDCGSFKARFDDVHAVVDDIVPGPTSSAGSYPEYAVAACGQSTGKATGFFHTRKIGDRWWLIDPRGDAFYMVGTDHIRFDGHWCEKLGYAPYGRTTATKYGSEEAWAKATAARLAEWGFNTLPAGHSPSLRHRRFAHIEFLSLGTSFAGTDDLCPQTTWTGFPNVFSPDWSRHCDKAARLNCRPNKDDPWLIGYFLDNELEWFGKSGKPWGLFDEAWRKPPDHPAKQAWVALLKDELKRPEAMKTHWGIVVPDFAALAAHTEPAPPLTEEAKAIARRWVRRVAEEYFRTCAEAVRRHDPNHLVLGCRFAGDAPDIWDIAGRYCDVVSFNMYPRMDVERGVPASVIRQIEQWHRRARKPLMITEWSFPALDTGLPCTHGAGMRVDTQAQRTQCFTHFQTAMFALPFMVGSDFFMFVDEPALGISTTFPEDSNYGLVDGQDNPYPELTAAAASLNPRVYSLHAAGDVPAATAGTPLASWVTAAPKHSIRPEETPLHVASGELQLEGPVEGHAWRLRLGRTLLGDLFPLLHQESGQEQWVAPDTARLVAVRETERLLVIDMELAREQPGETITRVDQTSGEREPQREGPKRFRTLWQFRVPQGGGGWISSQCLWVQNTDTTPWRLAEVFHFLKPCLGGDEENDAPIVPDVPNYYRRGAGWADVKAGVAVGCWYADEKFHSNYWVDPNGGHHADLMHAVNRRLAPGERVRVEGPLAFFFPVRGAEKAAFWDASRETERDVTTP